MRADATPMQAKTLASYDEIPYMPVAFPQSHPDRLATLALIFGIRAPAVEACRVLELGCAAGDNLIPMALALPDARFVGVDLSERQVAQGRAIVAELALDNIALRHADIADVDATWGGFDYIIVHGVYSWVPEGIRAKILTICRENLTPNGVAYVSYNTLPGWRSRGIIRDMMAYHARQFSGADARIAQARSLLEFLAQSTPPATAYGLTLKEGLDAIRPKDDSYVFHEYLEDINEPVYFHEFMAAARAQRLQYLGEASLRDMMLSNFPPPVAESLRRLTSDMIRLEQYMDFVRNRTFRQTLLVHEGVSIKRRLDWHSLRECLIASTARPASDRPTLVEGAPQSFQMEDGAMFTTSSAIAKAALILLWEARPRSIAFPALLDAARGRLKAQEVAPGPGSNQAQDAETLGLAFLQCFAAGAIEVHVWSPVFSSTPSPHPKASALARIQARRDGPVTNLRHEVVKIDGLAKTILKLADGSRDHATLAAEVTKMVERGALVLRPRQTGDTLAMDATLPEALGPMVDDSLSMLARSALLVE